MSAARLVRALPRPATLRAITRPPMAFRAAALAPFTTKPPTTAKPAPRPKQTRAVARSWFAPPPAPRKGMSGVRAAMPQLIPFYFVNEVTFAFAIIPFLVYYFSKYGLPKYVRLFAARLFISKL